MTPSPFSDWLFCSRHISPDFCFASPDRALDPRQWTALCLTTSGGNNFPRFSCKTSSWPVLVFHTRTHIRWTSSLWVAPHSQITVAQRRYINKPTSCCKQAASNPRHLLFAAASTWWNVSIPNRTAGISHIFNNTERFLFWINSFYFALTYSFFSQFFFISTSPEWCYELKNTAVNEDSIRCGRLFMADVTFYVEFLF